MKLINKFVLSLVLALCFISVNKTYAETLNNNYYPYNPRWADVYIGAAISTDADQSIDKPNWQSLYNPMQMLEAYSFDLNIGIRPLGLVPVIRNFRIEGETQYRFSKYDVINDQTLTTWAGQGTIPTYGKIVLKNVYMLNAYYDIRWFSDTFYPYVGVGFGTGTLDIRSIDFEKLPSGVGAEYTGEKKGVPVEQFMFGVQYDTKIIKTSVFLEYRYITSGSLSAHPNYNGREAGGDLPPGYTDPTNKDFSYKAQSLTIGIKYYLY
ncbi:outer membrane protein [Rickettsiales bacterium LUAb2]